MTTSLTTKVGKNTQSLDDNSLAKGMDKSIQDRQGVISKMSTKELKEAKIGSNRDSHKEFGCGELFKSHGIKIMKIGDPVKVLLSEDNNRDMKSTIEAEC